jgi:hypothetical protein
VLAEAVLAEAAWTLTAAITGAYQVWTFERGRQPGRLDVHPGRARSWRFDYAR